MALAPVATRVRPWLSNMSMVLQAWPGAIWLLLLVLAAPTAANDPLPLHVLDAAAATARGAVCLDGSPPGFYMGAAKAPADAKKWLLYFKGGGWCYGTDDASDKQNCLERSRTSLGSTALAAPTFRPGLARGARGLCAQEATTLTGSCGV